MHPLNINNPMKVTNIKCKPKHPVSTVVIYGSYMFEFIVSKVMKKGI
jgi:dTDP-glucose pyrophosphorylase